MMTDLRTSAQQALEALETWTPTFKMAIERKEKAITALKAALAEPSGKEGLQVERKPLTEDELDALRQSTERLNFVTLREFRIIARAIERAHGIGGNT